MLITISLLILAYMIMGKDVKPLLEKVRNIDLTRKIKDLKERMHPWAVKVGRAAARPLLQFYYVMDDEQTSTLDKVLIYAAIIYTIVPGEFIPKAVGNVIATYDADGFYYDVPGNSDGEIIRRKANGQRRSNMATLPSLYWRMEKVLRPQTIWLLCNGWNSMECIF